MTLFWDYESSFWTVSIYFVWDQRNTDFKKIWENLPNQNQSNTVELIVSQWSTNIDYSSAAGFLSIWILETLVLTRTDYADGYKSRKTKNCTTIGEIKPNKRIYRRRATLAWKQLQERYSRENGPRRARLTKEHQGMVPKLFSKEKNEGFQVRDEQWMKQHAGLNNCDLQPNECNEEEAMQVSLQREYQCFYCKETHL